jgi:hypothetical protein
MLPKLKYHLTNWVDGMKINRQHFVDSENALIDQIRDNHATTLNVYNYGLLAPIAGEKTSLDCNVLQSQTRQFKVNVPYCRAVTAGGCRIEILPGIHPELVSDSSIFSDTDGYEGLKAGNYLVVISVDPYNRQPFGPASGEEYPPRNQFSVAAYRLSLLPEDSIHTGSFGANNLPIARFQFRNGEFVKDNNYIPPCAVVGAHPGTKQIYNTIAERLNLIQEISADIVQKIVETGQNAALALNLRKICELSVMHVSSANTVVKLANIINVSLSFLSVKEKEEILQYFSYWNEISPGKFEEMIAAVINADYDHEQIYDFFQPLLSFLKVWAELLEKLKDLKLIGQKNEKFDFGGRTMETPKEKGKGKFSIFD